MSGESTSSRRSNRDPNGADRKSDGYTGEEGLREFTFTVGTANAQGRLLKARNGIAELVGRKLGDDIYQLMKNGKEAEFEEPSPLEIDHRMGSRRNTNWSTDYI